MIMKPIAHWLCPLLCILTDSAVAGPPISVSLDPAAAGPGKFAAAEIRKEAVARGLALVEENDPASAEALRITLAVGLPSDAGTVPQSYRIRVSKENGRRTIAVRGATPAA